MSPTLFPVQFILSLLVISALDVLCIGETENHGNTRSYKMSTTDRDDGNLSNQRHVVSICENGLLRAKCDDGKVIRFLEAHYGRLNLATCNHDYNMDWNLNCRSNISKKIMREKCDKKRDCNVEASNLVFGDPCFGTIKYLEMQYMCVNANEISEILMTEEAPEKATPKDANGNKPNEKIVCEKSKMQVTCEKGKVIHIIQANYGRTTLSKCNPKKNNKFNVKCGSNKSKKIMQDKCHGKSSCSVEATNSVFGDPCPKTEKYLEVKYRCVKETTTKKITTKRITPKATTPKRITPKATTPKKITPKATSPKATSPKATSPKATSPKATSPKATTPNRSSSKETTPKMTTLIGSTPEGKTTTVNRERTTSKETTTEGNKPISISACEGANLNAECEGGKMIYFIQANYGRTSLSKCNPNNIETLNVKCRSNNSGEIIQQKCGGKRSCVVEASNSLFGDPCSGTIKYLEMLYMCIPEEVTTTYLNTETTIPRRTTSKEETTTELLKTEITTSKSTTPEARMPLSKYACENTKLIVQCEKGKVIDFLQGNYGRTTLSKCNTNNIKTWNVKCLSKQSGAIMREKCNGKRSCVIEAKNSVFGEPCQNTLKYLEMQYFCIPEKTTTVMFKTTEIMTSKSTTPEAKIPLSKYACENTKLIVECERGKVIDFLQGNYGRTTLTKCNPNNIKTWNVKCLSKHSGKIMRDKCFGRRSCVIDATNSVFGDPCQDTLKYLEMQYLCIPESTIYEKIIIPTSTNSVSVAITNAVSSGKASPTVSDDVLTTVSDHRTTFNDITTMHPDIHSTLPEILTNHPNTLTNNPIIATSSILDISTNNFDNRETVLEFSTKDPVSPTTNPDIRTNNPGFPTDNRKTVLEISTPTNNPDDDTKFLKLSTKDNYILTTASDTITEKVTQTKTSHEETSAPSISNTSNNPSKITTADSVITECDEQDLRCLKFKCPQDMGNFPHPSNKKFFIFCINWKPRVKTCGTGLVFSEKFMTCVK